MQAEHDKTQNTDILIDWLLVFIRRFKQSHMSQLHSTFFFPSNHKLLLPIFKPLVFQLI